ncbi:YARHG domain-containing protein [Clostridium sp.]
MGFGKAKITSVKQEKVEDRDPNLYIKRAEAALGRQDINRALFECDKAIEYSNGDVNYIFEKVKILFHSGSYYECSNLIDNNLFNFKTKYAKNRGDCSKFEELLYFRHKSYSRSGRKLEALKIYFESLTYGKARMKFFGISVVVFIIVIVIVNSMPKENAMSDFYAEANEFGNQLANESEQKQELIDSSQYNEIIDPQSDTTKETVMDNIMDNYRTSFDIPQQANVREGAIDINDDGNVEYLLYVEGESSPENVVAIYDKDTGELKANSKLDIDTVSDIKALTIPGHGRVLVFIDSSQVPSNKFRVYQYNTEINLIDSLEINGTYKTEDLNGDGYQEISSYENDAMTADYVWTESGFQNSMVENKQYVSENIDITGDYILQGSDIRYLEAGELISLNKSELSLARNEIFARHGYVFNDEVLKSFFETKGWYIPDPSYVEQLSEIEKYNIDLIKYYEQSAK